MPAFDTPEPISARIDLVRGDARISAGDRTTTVVNVAPGDPSNAEDRRAAEQTRVEYANGRLLVKAPRARSWLPENAGGAVDVTIELPAASNVHGSNSLGDFHCDGPLGDCRIKTGIGRIELDEAETLNLTTGIGDISAGRASGHADVTSGSGDIQLRELDSSAVIKNSNGDTWIGRAGGDLRLKASNGDIAVDESRASVGAKAANGDVRLADVVRGSVVLETHLGDLEVGIREGTTAWLDVRAKAGRVHNALESAEAPEPSHETVDVRARTAAGDVVIRRP